MAADVPPFTPIADQFHHFFNDTLTTSYIEGQVADGSMEDLEAHLSRDEIRKELSQRVSYPIDDNSVAEQLKTRLNEQNEFGIALLHIAIGTGNEEAFERLLQDRELLNLDVQDRLQNTPLHYAAVLGHRLFMDRLLESGADPQIRNVYGGTYEDLFSLCHPTFEAEEQCFLYFDGEERLMRNRDEFRDMTGAEFLRDNIYICPEEWVHHFWFTPLYEKRGFAQPNPQLLAEYTAFLANPPTLYVESDPNCGYVVKAGQSIPAYTIVGEYTGEFNPHKLSQKSERLDLEKEQSELSEDETLFWYSDNPEGNYLIGDIDGYEYRNLMGLMASSFPNVIPVYINNAGGYSSRVVLYSIEEIEEGEPFVFDYLFDQPVKNMPYSELRLLQMEAFFREHTHDDLRRILSASPRLFQGADLTEYIESKGRKAQALYLLSTPTAMLRMVLTDQLGIDVIEDLFTLIDIEMYSAEPQMLFFTTFAKAYRLAPELVKEELLGRIGNEGTLSLYRRMKTLLRETLINSFPDSSAESS